MLTRVGLFVNLPLKVLDNTAIKKELTNIANTTKAE
ncbi:arsenate reductase [Acidovorax soli]|uniref:Arsenate reductase n=2 Tax=Acidovorax soli TaxID=592050 RepID=A0A1H4C6S9_9BURK|nr:arsenate reductase [Acidovorax soli]